MGLSERSLPELPFATGRTTTTQTALIQSLDMKHQKHSPIASFPQLSATLRHMKAPRDSQLLNLRQMAYQLERLWFKLDDNSGAGHFMASEPVSNARR